MTLSEMNFVLPDLMPAAAEIFLLAAVSLILVIDVFLRIHASPTTF